MDKEIRKMRQDGTDILSSRLQGSFDKTSPVAMCISTAERLELKSSPESIQPSGPVFCKQGYGRGGKGTSLCGAGKSLPGIFKLIAFSNSIVTDNRLCEESPAQPG